MDWSASRVRAVSDRHAGGGQQLLVDEALQQRQLALAQRIECHAEGREFSPGAFPESITPMDLPGDRWVDLRRQGLEM